MYRYEKRESKLKKFFRIMLLIAVTSASSIFLYKMYLNINISETPRTDESTGTAIRLSAEKNEDTDISNILENTIACVVGISKIRNTGEGILDTNATENLNLGTGVIVSDNGYIVTNWHLAGNKYSSCYVTLEDGTVYNGNTVWADSDLDLAIVKIATKGLKYMALGDSEHIRVGDEVYAIGNPIGIEFQRTVTSGIISGLNRTIKIEEKNTYSYMEDLIQTDASINQGNSGGPLINRKGEVIGINSVKIESAEGIGFAVPINIIKPIIESFTSKDEFEEAYLGIFAYDKEVIKYLKNNVDFEGGIYVVKISKDGPVAKTNIKIGDIITKIDGNNINKMSELRKYIYQKKPGDKVELVINRNNKEYKTEVKLNKK
jgi:serine protease Do